MTQQKNIPALGKSSIKLQQKEKYSRRHDDDAVQTNLCILNMALSHNKKL